MRWNPHTHKEMKRLREDKGFPASQAHPSKAGREQRLRARDSQSFSTVRIPGIPGKRPVVRPHPRVQLRWSEWGCESALLTSSLGGDPRRTTALGTHSQDWRPGARGGKGQIGGPFSALDGAVGRWSKGSSTTPPHPHSSSHSTEGATYIITGDVEVPPDLVQGDCPLTPFQQLEGQAQGQMEPPTPRP